VNDSKSTNVDSTKVALKAFSQPILLILGGRHKGTPYTSLLHLLKEKVRRVLTIGEAHPEIMHDLKNQIPITSCRTLKKAVHAASQLARAGDVVILSPACASFDQYENFEERGRHFVRLVKNLPS
jgi:UDP-N-acetylmuramoylalanine--D-glutamate ligase